MIQNLEIEEPMNQDSTIRTQKRMFSKGLVIFLVVTIIVFAFVFAFKSNLLVSKSGPLLGEFLTVGKIDGREIELCHGNKMKRTFPDFDYALYGYNIIQGYPMATGHDPGLTRPIFVADYTGSEQTADCRYQIPRGYFLAPDVACVTSFTSDTIKDSSEFSKYLSISAEIEGGGWGAKFSASAEHKTKSSQMSASQSVFIFSKAVCNYYFSKLNIDEPPSLTKNFIDHVKTINSEQEVFKFSITTALISRSIRFSGHGSFTKTRCQKRHSKMRPAVIRACQLKQAIKGFTAWVEDLG